MSGSICSKHQWPNAKCPLCQASVDEEEPRVLFLDVDGVVADFVTPLMKLFGSPTTNETLYTYDISKHLETTYDAIWAHPRVTCEEFWAGLPKLPWADELVECCLKGYPEVAFLTQPIRSPSSLAGKKRWLDAHYPHVPFFVSNKKWLVSAPGHVLIDDHEKNVEEWKRRGGTGILFPAAWNSKGHHKDPIQTLGLRG